MRKGRVRKAVHNKVGGLGDERSGGSLPRRKFWLGKCRAVIHLQRHRMNKDDGLCKERERENAGVGNRYVDEHVMDFVVTSNPAAGAWCRTCF
jgi:hypothetical protein